MFQNKARSSGGRKPVVFAEGEEQKVIRAAHQIVEEGIATPILIGHPDVINEQITTLGIDYKPVIVDPAHFDHKLDSYAEAYYEFRSRKRVTMRDALKKVREPNVLGPMW